MNVTVPGEAEDGAGSSQNVYVLRGGAWMYIHEQLLCLSRVVTWSGFCLLKKMSLTVYAMKMDSEVTSLDAGRPGRKVLQRCMKEIVHV